MTVISFAIVSATFAAFVPTNMDSAALYVPTGSLGVWAASKVVCLNVKFRSLAPAVTACVE